jgi:hypothetical protein
LPGVCFSYGLAGFHSSSLYITGTLYIAIDMPFTSACIFSNLQEDRSTISLNSNSLQALYSQKP